MAFLVNVYFIFSVLFSIGTPETKCLLIVCLVVPKKLAQSNVLRKKLIPP